MKKFLMLIAVVAVMAAPVFAQSAFSDVDEGHWAYNAVNTLANDGIVVGYPDGEFKGKRTMTRYEFAMVINAIIPKLVKDYDLSAYATKDDLAAYAKVGDIKGADLSGVASKADLDLINKLANEFKAELAALGTDVNALQADVNALKARVAAVEDEQARVKINGSFTVASKYAFKKDTDNIMDYDGNIFPEGSQGVTLLKDFQIDIKGRVSNNVNAYISLVAGDYMKKGIEKEGAWGTTVSNNGDVSVIPYYMYATVDMNKFGDFKLGRMPFQVNKYVYKRYDTDSYTDIARMDNGDYAVDGVDYTKDFGFVDLRAWFVKPQDKTFYDFTTAGFLPIKDVVGAQPGLDIATAKLNVLGSYPHLTKDSYVTYKTKIAHSKLWGATVEVPFGDFKLDGAFFQQGTQKLDKAKLFDVNGTLNWNGLSVTAGYKQVEKGYKTMGDWEAMAFIHNPDNIKGFNAAAKYELGRFDISGAYKNYKEKEETGLYADDNKIQYWNVAAGYDTGKVGKFTAKYEQLKEFGSKYKYFTVSWLKTYGNANFKLGYQNVNNKDEDNKGNFLFGQATYNF